MNHTISVSSLVTCLFFTLGIGGLLLTTVGVLPLRAAPAGIGLCFIGNLCYFRRALQEMNAREVQAFEVGRDSVRSIRRS